MAKSISHVVILQRSGGICFSFLLLLATLVLVAPTSAQQMGTRGAPGSIGLPGEVKPGQPGVSFTGPKTVVVPAGVPAAVHLRFQVSPGFHINSHTPREKELIPSRLALVLPAGMSVKAVDFPAGEDYAFSFDPQHKLSVYSGDFILTAHVLARTGEYELPGVLHYQACDNTNCFPPRDLDVQVRFVAK